MSFTAKTLLFLVVGMASGGLVWLWMQYGGAVVLAYAQGVVMRCL